MAGIITDMITNFDFAKLEEFGRTATELWSKYTGAHKYPNGLLGSIPVFIETFEFNTSNSITSDKTFQGIDVADNVSVEPYSISISIAAFTDFYIDNVIYKEAKDTNRLINSVLYKSEDWEYEKEWRFIITKSEYDGKTVSTPKPKSIYLGSQIKEAHKEQFIKVCKENDIDIYQMKLDGKMYKLNVEKL